MTPGEYSPSALTGQIDLIASIIFRVFGSTIDADVFRRALIGSMMSWLVVPIARDAESDDLQALRSEVERLYRDGKYAESSAVERLYVVRAKQQHGPNHIEYATAISWLASSLQAEVRRRQAEPPYTRSRAIREKGLGSDHPDVGQWRWRKG